MAPRYVRDSQGRECSRMISPMPRSSTSFGVNQPVWPMVRPGVHQPPLPGTSFHFLSEGAGAQQLFLSLSSLSLPTPPRTLNSSPSYGGERTPHPLHNPRHPSTPFPLPPRFFLFFFSPSSTATLAATHLHLQSDPPTVRPTYTVRPNFLPSDHFLFFRCVRWRPLM